MLIRNPRMPPGRPRGRAAPRLREALMSLRSWTSIFFSLSGATTPPFSFGLRRRFWRDSIFLTGFISASTRGCCIGLLLIVILDARPRTCFACGFVPCSFSSLPPCLGLPPCSLWHGGLSARAAGDSDFLIATCWALSPGHCLVLRCLRSAALALACRAPFYGHVRVRSRASSKWFPWNCARLLRSRDLALLQITAISGIWGLSFLVAFHSLLAWMALAPAPPVRIRATLLAAATFSLLPSCPSAPFVPRTSANHYAVPYSPISRRLWSTRRMVSGSRPYLETLEQLSSRLPTIPPIFLSGPKARPVSFEDPVAPCSLLAIHFSAPFSCRVIEWEPAPR